MVTWRANMEQELVRILRAKQAELGETNESFAVRLGISKSTWDKTALGQMRVGWLVLRASARAFPELREMALNYLLSDADKVAV
jgi:hypothetical protein